MKFIAHKTDDGRNKGKISFYCEALGVSRQGFYKYLENRDKPSSPVLFSSANESEYRTV